MPPSLRPLLCIGLCLMVWVLPVTGARVPLNFYWGYRSFPTALQWDSSPEIGTWFTPSFAQELFAQLGVLQSAYKGSSQTLFTYSALIQVYSFDPIPIMRTSLSLGMAGHSRSEMGACASLLFQWNNPAFIYPKVMVQISKTGTVLVACIFSSGVASRPVLSREDTK